MPFLERVILMCGFFIIVLLCIGAFYHCKHHGCHSSKSNRTHQDALDIVRERYARGDINSEEFIERQEALREGKSKK